MAKAWLVWEHDPCYEGGWHILGEFDTRNEAVQAAKDHHARELAQLMDMRQDEPGYIGCYDRVVVTPATIFSLEVPQVLHPKGMCERPQCSCHFPPGTDPTKSEGS